MQFYFMIFILFGFWNSWPNFRHEAIFRLNSILSIALIVLNFTSAIIFGAFYKLCSLSEMIANFLFILEVLTHSVIILESIFKSGSQMALLKKFSFVNYLCSKKLRVKIFKRRERRQIFVRFLLMVLVQVISRIIIIVCGTYWKCTFNFLYVSLFPELVIGFKLIQIWFFVYIMHIRLFLVNKQLNDLIRHTRSASRNKITDFKSVHIRLLLFKKVFALKRIYGELHDICDRIGATFSWSLLAIVLCIFTNLTFNAYWIFVNLTKIKNLVLNVILMTPNLIVLSILAMYCSSSAGQVSQNHT